jgi:hypothetical protein
MKFLEKVDGHTHEYPWLPQQHSRHGTRGVRGVVAIVYRRRRQVAVVARWADVCCGARRGSASSCKHHDLGIALRAATAFDVARNDALCGPL